MNTETAPSGRRSLDQASRLESQVCLCRQPVNRIHHRHLLSLLSQQPDTHFTVPRRVEGWVNLGGCYIPRWYVMVSVTLVLDLYLGTIFGYLYLYFHAKYWYCYWCLLVQYLIQDCQLQWQWVTDFYSIINPPGPRVRLEVTHSQFHATTFHLIFVLFVSQLPKYGIPHILQSQTLSPFRRHLKTHYFQSAYPAP